MKTKYLIFAGIMCAVSIDACYGRDKRVYDEYGHVIENPTDVQRELYEDRVEMINTFGSYLGQDTLFKTDESQDKYNPNSGEYCKKFTGEDYTNCLRDQVGYLNRQGKAKSRIQEYAAAEGYDATYDSVTGTWDINRSSKTTAPDRDESKTLYGSMASKSVRMKDLCLKKLGDLNSRTEDADECEYFSPVYGLCDTHAYNLNGMIGSQPMDSNDVENIQQIVADKTTVISQQMYKQYQYLAATLRRLKIQLEKNVLTAKLQMAGATSDGSNGNSGGGSSSSRNNANDNRWLSSASNCWLSTTSGRDEMFACMQNNLGVIMTNAEKDKKNAYEQLKDVFDLGAVWGVDKPEKCKNVAIRAKDITQCAQSYKVQLIQYKVSKEEEKNRPQIYLPQQNNVQQ